MIISNNRLKLTCNMFTNNLLAFYPSKAPSLPFFVQNYTICSSNIDKHINIGYGQPPPPPLCNLTTSFRPRSLHLLSFVLLFHLEIKVYRQFLDNQIDIYKQKK